MKFKYFIGIDISKLTLDITILHQGKKILFKNIKNNIKNIRDFVFLIKDTYSCSVDELLFMMEFTGTYNYPLVQVLEDLGGCLWQANAIHIMRSGGLQRGKNDKLDSYRIAMFAFRNIDQYKKHIPVRKELKEIKRLFAVRRNLVKVRTQIKALMGDYDFVSKKTIAIEASFLVSPINVLEDKIKALEEELNRRIMNDPKLCRLYIIITSIIGIAMITAIKIIIVTNEFKKHNNPKALACHAGVAPFDHSSGSSVRKLTRVSQMADKELKKLLHMAAISAMSHPGEIRDYYLRKSEKGTHKMKVINNIRNKLIHRVFACVKSDRLYERQYQRESNLHLTI